MGIEKELLGEWFVYGSQSGYKYSLVGVGRPAITLADITPQAGMDLRQSLDWGGNYYGPDELKSRILAAQEYGSAQPEELFLTNGTYEANYVAMAALVSAGDEVIVEEPAWTQIRMLARAFGASVKTLPLRPENGWKPDPDELRSLVGAKTRLVYINHPNNPTGSVLNDREMREIVEAVSPSGAYLLSDEIYRGLEWDGPLGATAIDHYERAIVTNSLTKTLGLCGLRLGWLATHDKEARDKAFTVHRYSVMVTNVLGERLATEALNPNVYSHLLESGMAIGRRNREVIREWIDQHDAFAWTAPSAGYTSFVHFQLPVTSWDLCMDLLKTPYNTYLVPGVCYHERFDDYVRVGFGGKSADTIQPALDRIEAYCRSRI